MPELAVIGLCILGLIALRYLRRRVLERWPPEGQSPDKTEEPSR